VTNKLYYGDNLEVLREHVADESVDLVYLDPPFNSNANYNILFKSPAGQAADSQIEAFEDTWHWTNHPGGSEDCFEQVIRSGNTDAAELLRAMRSFLGDNDMMAYLAMMAIRLIELHRVLKATGSLYLHCDPTASHYLKLLLDAVFGAENFQNEVIWKRTTTKTDAKQGATNWPRLHDTILCYAKSVASKPTFHQPFAAYSDDYLSVKYRYSDPDGRRYRLDKLTAPGMGSRGHPTYEFMGVTKPWVYNKEKMEALLAAGRIVQNKPGNVPQYKRYLDEVSGVAIGDVWTDFNAINSMAQERLGYPTQKPLALLERIIAASSNEGDVVLDPFCGCGTAVDAAQKLAREWIGIDVTHLAISLIEKRLRDRYPGIAFEVHGTPRDLASAEDLALRDKYQFQWWAVSMVDALPFGGKKKGADGGIDGIIYFNDYDAKAEKMQTHRAIVSVKGGLKPSVNMVETLAACIEREKAPIGVLIMNALPTREMERRAAAVGNWRDGIDDSYPRLQILTLAELFQGKKPRIPNVDRSVVKRAKREEGRQGSLL
jgi:site-specific DNA-methyltransferase (adenine-specific)